MRNTNGYQKHPTPPNKTLPIQPHPLMTQLAAKTINGVTLSAISRHWAPGESKYCRLCPSGTCAAQQESCLILTTQPVGNDEAPLYRSSGIAPAVLGPTLFRPAVDDQAVNVWRLGPAAGREVFDPKMPLEARDEEPRLIPIQGDRNGPVDKQVSPTIGKTLDPADIVEV